MNLTGSIEQMALGFTDTHTHRVPKVRFVRIYSPITIGFSKIVVRDTLGRNVSDGKKIIVNSIALGSLKGVLNETGFDESYIATCSARDVAIKASGTGLLPRTDEGMLGVAYTRADARKEYSSYGDSSIEVDLGAEYDVGSIEIIKPDWRLLYASLETCDAGAIVVTSTQTIHHLVKVGISKMEHTGAFKPVPLMMKDETFKSININYQPLADRKNGLNLAFGQKFRRRLMSLVDWKNVNVGEKYKM